MCPWSVRAWPQHVLAHAGVLQVSCRSASLCRVYHWLCPCPAGIMLGRMGDSGAPLVSFCQCLNESVMKIVAVAVW